MPTLIERLEELAAYLHRISMFESAEVIREAITKLQSIEAEAYRRGRDDADESWIRETR